MAPVRPVRSVPWACDNSKRALVPPAHHVPWQRDPPHVSDVAPPEFAIGNVAAPPIIGTCLSLPASCPWSFGAARCCSSAMAASRALAHPRTTLQRPLTAQEERVAWASTAVDGAPKFKCPLRPGGLKPWTQQLDQRLQKVSSIRGFVEDDRSVRERRPPDLQG